MKKTFFTLMLMLVSAVVINAQSLTSNAWMTVLPIEDVESGLVINFKTDGTCVLAMAFDETEDLGSGMKMTIQMTVMMPGTYTLNDKDLNVIFDRDNAETEIGYEIAGVDDATKKMMDSMLKPELEKQKPELTKQLLGMLPDMNNMKVVSVSNEKLVLADEGGNEMTFDPAPDF
ncbi:MAG: hypothetical protein J6X22_09730 [Muribaculaceae bacterium]|nr:hypothetical protein [Muribaculaceae bacterium]